LDRQVIYLFILTCVGFISTYCLVPVAKRLAPNYGLVSYPGVRKIHTEIIPVVGGIAIFAPQVMLFTLFICLSISGLLSIDQVEAAKFVSLFLGSLWILLLGIIDDRKNLGWKKKLLGQIVAIGILLLGGNSIAIVDVPLYGLVDFGPFGYPLLGLVVLIVTNAVNLIDGMDGLAGGVCLFAAITCGIFAFYRNDLLIASIAFTISGSLVAFLRYNFPPATIFMGDSGSLSLGFLLSALATSNIAKTSGQRYTTFTALIALLLPFGIALLDVFLSVSRRWIRGKKIFLPDSDHIHHQFMNMFKRPRLVVGIFYVFSSLFCLLTLLITMNPGSHLTSIFGTVTVVALVIIMTIVLKLYRVDTLANVLKNRPDFKFLSSFHSYMKLRIYRVKGSEELLILLERGVRDLEFDSVEVRSGGSRLHSWNKPEKVHPKAQRTNGHRSLKNCDIIIVWTIPTHNDRPYQKYLELVWHRFLNQVEEKNVALINRESTKSIK
jgi:UDP-GlcNAc:undecaprenyl-phosphate/decaprenyl-phosphate GlcNAc-1-phosphate transferase